MRFSLRYPLENWHKPQLSEQFLLDRFPLRVESQHSHVQRLAGLVDVQHCLALVLDRRVVILELIAGVAIAAASLVNASPVVDLDRLWIWVVAILAGLAFIVGLLCLYSSALAYAADPIPAKFWQAFRFRLRPMAWLLTGMAALLLLSAGSEFLLWMLNDNDRHFGLILRATSLTSNYLLPCLVLPWVAAKAIGGRLREGLQPLRSWRYWVGMALIVYGAQWFSDELWASHSGISTFWMQVARTMRLTLTYLPLVVKRQDTIASENFQQTTDVLDGRPFANNLAVSLQRHLCARGTGDLHRACPGAHRNLVAQAP